MLVIEIAIVMLLSFSFIYSKERARIEVLLLQVFRDVRLLFPEYLTMMQSTMKKVMDDQDVIWEDQEERRHATHSFQYYMSFSQNKQKQVKLSDF